MTCTLVSSAFYVQNPLAEETKEALAGPGPSPTQKKDAPLDSRAAAKVFLTSDGRPCIWHGHFLGSLVMTGTQQKNGTSLITIVGPNRQKDYRGGYYFQLLGSYFPIVNPEKPDEPAKWYTEIMDPPNKVGQRVPEPCPLWEAWQTDIAFRFDENGMREDTVKEWITKAGLGMGIGAARIGRGAALGYGTFEILDGSWREIPDADVGEFLANLPRKRPTYGDVARALEWLLIPYNERHAESLEASGNGAESKDATADGDGQPTKRDAGYVEV
ncbi:MAG: hypothetical protein G01um101438_1003 [Parcubacteria group bacterium Gr01-1014_38]|nr:MAG: hypothetical protein G01um101438_1003 [Parcubacteria group bacterium Gr01-1014_38]